MTERRPRRSSARSRLAFIFVLALILTSLNGAFVSFSANPSADLDQCANDPAPSPNTDGCSASASDWVNGNLGASKANYFEGDSIPYRLRFDNLSLGTHNVIIEWDTTKSGTHAIDYLTTYNRTVATANPCLGVTSCGAPTTFPIPADPQVTGAGVTPVAGNFTLYGGLVTAVSAYSYPNGAGFVGDKSARITITFTATQANPVLAWGGHIASRVDWGLANSAVNIPGSPYHTRLIDLDGAGGNQDRSLSAEAVIFPAHLTIVKNTSGGNGTFNFTSTGGLPAPADASGNFSITTAAGTGSATFSITTFGTYTVTEAAAAGYTLTSVSCTPIGSGNLATRTASVNLAEGNDATCTFANTLQSQDVSIAKTARAATVNAGSPATYDITVTAGGNASSTGVTLTDNLTATGLSWTVSGADAAACSPNPVSGTLTCNFGTMASGTSKTITLTATTTAANCANGLSNTATVSATGDTNTSNNSSGPIVIAVVCQPDVSVIKSGNGPLTAGQSATFSITVSAGGTGPSSNVTLTDTLPSGTWTLGGPDAAQCSITSGSLSCAFGTMASGTSKTVTLSRATTGADCPQITNPGATVSATGDTNTDNNSTGPKTIVVNCQPDVTVVKTGNGPLTAGTPAMFTITVTAGGTGPSSNVTLSDTLPAGTWTLGGADAASCNIVAGVLSCTFGTMASGTSKVVTLSRATTGADCPSIANTVTVNATGDTNTNNNSDSETITVTCAPDVSIVKSGSAAISAGETATFTITVSAGGTGPSSNVTVTDTLPAGTWTLGGTDAASCNVAAGVLTCTFGTMAQGTSKTVTLSRATNAEDCPAIDNTAVVSATTDTNTQNNSSTASVTVNCGDITLGKTADKSSVNAGDTIGFVIAIANLGDGTATGVTVSDPLPAGPAWTIDTAASDPGCAIASGILTCSYGDLGPAASRSVHITSPTTAEQCGTLDNLATATTTNDGGAEARASIVVNCQPDASVTKTGNGPLSAGQTAVFTITVAAAGTGPSSNVTLSDTLPAGTWTLGGANAASCTLASSSLSCTFGTMASGTSKTITLSRLTTTGDCSTPIANTATVNATTDANTTNNTSSASIGVTCPPPPERPQLVVSKTPDTTLVTAGVQGNGTVGFTVTVTNNGFIATTATLSDTPLVGAAPSTPAGNAGTLGLTWSIDAAGSDAGCSIVSNSLSCSFGTLQPGASKHVHITAPATGRTTAASRADNCGQRVDNVAIATMGNGGSVQSNHAIVDIVCLPTTSAGSLTITKYGDNNANALKDPAEQNLAGWTFEVKNNATGEVRTATTGANGSVTINDLVSGQYTVTEKSCASPCDITKWKPISYVISGQSTVSDRSGSAQVTIAAPEQSITFGNQPPLLPSTSTEDNDRDRIQALVLLLLAALVAQILILRVVARYLPSKES